MADGPHGPLNGRKAAPVQDPTAAKTQGPPSFAPSGHTPAYPLAKGDPGRGQCEPGAQKTETLSGETTGL